MLKLLLLAFGLFYAVNSYAFGSMIVVAVAGSAFAATAAGIAIAMAINMIVSTIVSKAFFTPTQPDSAGYGSGSSPDPGNRQQVPPATDNKLPIVYGSAYVGGTITDLSISSDNQQLYYVMSLCEVTSTNDGQTPDTISFGDIYYGGKKVIFQGDGYTVASLLDESTGAYDTAVNGRIQIFLYNNGSNSPTNSGQSAISVMQSSGLTYTWDNSKLMTDCAFAIIHLSYSQSANVRGIEQTKFQITNSRINTGDCFYDYLVNTRYGCAILPEQVDIASLTALTVYSNESFTYTDSSGFPATQARFKFNGTIDPKRTVMQNLQDMGSCCDCLIKYTEITGLWGVVVQSPTYSVAMNINDSNMISAIQITPLDIAASYNVVECKFPDESNQDAFNSTTFDLATLDPILLYPNEPVNKVSLSLPLTNNSVTAQYLATRLLKSGREDLQVQVSVSFIGVQLDAGDIVTVTNSNYGWIDKLFRINKVVQQFNDDGSIAVQLNMSEFNPTVYDDTDITQFQPAPNTGIGSPTAFGSLTAPYVVSSQPTATIPSFQIEAYTAPFGVTQYVEVWYSAFSNPLQEQMYFGGTSAIQSNGNPYLPFTLIPAVTLSGIPSGDWYFFTRCVNSISSSAYSPHSTLFTWRPTTFQYTQRYISVAYADDVSGGGFSFDPRGKDYYGLFNQNNATPNVTASNYSWYLAPTNFSTSEYVLFSNRGGRLFSFAQGFAAYAATTARFVPTQTLIYDPSIWNGLPDGTNIIDLDARTGQLTTTGTTTVGTGQVQITNNTDGNIVASLQEYLDFGGAYTKTSSVATLTIDIYGRVVGFETPDDFYYTATQYIATANQTVFTQTRASGYISGQCLVFSNGLLFDPTQYTDTGGTTGTVTLGTGANAGDRITIIAFKSTNPTTGVYSSFNRNIVTLTNQSSYTASGFTLMDGFELLFLNGTVVNAQDYSITGQDITFSSNATGELQVIQWSINNLGVANGTPVNVDLFTVIGQTIYPFSYNINAFNLYSNGSLLVQGTDYTTASGTFTLSVSPTVNTNILVQQTFARTGAV